MRAQSWQLDIGQYDLRFTTAPLYTQLDTARHVNNGGVLSFHTEARVRLQMAALGERSWFSDGMLLRPRRTVTQFIDQVHYPGEVTGAARLVAIDDDSYRLALGVFQEGECVGVQDCLMGAWQGDRWRELPRHVAGALRAQLHQPPSLMSWPESNTSKAANWPCHSRWIGRYFDLDPDQVLAERTLACCIEQSRARPVGAIRPSDYGLMVARLDMRFHRWDKGVADITLPSGITRIGNTSFVVHGLVEADGDLVADGESVLVMIDYARQKTVPIEGELLDKMKQITVEDAQIKSR